ncbi:MAG: hypothetical protein ABMA64_13535 [Myxococcota bacterium]
MNTFRRWWVAIALVLAFFAAPARASDWTRAPERAERRELPVVPEGWTTVPGTYLRVHAPEPLVHTALRMAQHGSEALPKLADRLEVPIGETIHVFVAPDDATFRALQPGAPPTWADATAWPELGVVFLRGASARKASDAPLEQVFDHELVHVLLGRAFEPQRPPTWLQEGVAQLLAGELGPEEARTLGRASVSGWIGLESIERGFPSDPFRAELAYAESADFVAYLVDQHGEQVLPALIKASARGEPLRRAVFTATGTLFESAEADWRATHTPSDLRLAALADGEWLWVVGAFVLLGAFVRRRREFHRRLAQMEAEEALVDAWIAAARRV